MRLYKKCFSSVYLKKANSTLAHIYTKIDRRPRVIATRFLTDISYKCITEVVD